MKAVVHSLSLLLLVPLGLSGCSLQKQNTEGWSPDPAKRGRPFFEGARMGWHAAGAEDGS